MIEIGPATEDDMVLAFLKAEARSAKRGPHYEHVARSKGLNLARLVDHVDPSETADQARRELLAGVRGYGVNRAIFYAFPDDTSWRRVEVEPSDHGRLLYINTQGWRQASGETRCLLDANESIKAHLTDLIAAVGRGDTFSDVILVEDGMDNLVILEGNHRATAFVLCGRSFPALVGRSAAMNQWCSISFD